MVAAVAAIPETLVTLYLEMTDRRAFRPAYINNPRVKIAPMSRADIAFYLFMYREVGYQWRWRDRLVMPKEELEAAISKPGVSIHILYVDGAPAGYVELAREGDSTEIAYFGLREAYHGHGFGKHLLSYGIAKAWADGAKRVWVHTCNLDGPHALDNYLKRGFSVYGEDRKPMPSRYTA